MLAREEKRAKHQKKDRLPRKSRCEGKGADQPIYFHRVKYLCLLSQVYLTQGKMVLREDRSELVLILILVLVLTT